MTSTYSPTNWLPKEHGIYNCEGVLDDYEGFRVLARGENKGSPMFRIAFDVVEAYYAVEESSCFNDSRRAGGLVQGDWCFTVDNSWFLKELHEISSGVREGFELKHYALYFANQCIDILSYEDPVIENLND